MATEKLAEHSGATETLEAGDFAALLSKEFKPKSDRAKEEVESAVRTLAEQVLNAVPRFNERGFTLQKGKSRGRIDACIALGLACDQALHHAAAAPIPEFFAL